MPSIPVKVTNGFISALLEVFVAEEAGVIRVFKVVTPENVLEGLIEAGLTVLIRLFVLTTAAVRFSLEALVLINLESLKLEDFRSFRWSR